MFAFTFEMKYFNKKSFIQQKLCYFLMDEYDGII